MRMKPNQTEDAPFSALEGGKCGVKWALWIEVWAQQQGCSCETEAARENVLLGWLALVSSPFSHG